MNQPVVSPDLLAKWLKAWALSRKLPLPVKYKSGFKVDVGNEKQIARYVFPELNDDFIHLSQSIKEPWIFLKVCASPDEINGLVSNDWKFQPQGYMMHCNGLMKFNTNNLSA